MTTRTAFRLIPALTLVIAAIIGLFILHERNQAAQRQENLFEALGGGHEARDRLENELAMHAAQVNLASNIAWMHPDDPSAFTNILNSLRRPH